MCKSVKAKPQRWVTTLIAVLTAGCLTLIGLPAATRGDSSGRIHVGRFSAGVPGGDLPSEWAPLVFEKIEAHTAYSLAETEGTVAVKAESEASASGLIRKIQIDPIAFPIVTWHWKVRNVLEKGDVSRKEGDDYPARIYITFAYDPDKLSFFERAKYKAAKLVYGEYPPTGAINYIWGSHAAVGTVTPNPFTERAMMIVVESGKEKLNQWVRERRNILDDYRQAFQADPPAISGVAIMTDTDNTGESAVAYFGDILFSKE